MPRLNENGLTPNQQIFADEWLIDRNGTRAYMVAYPRVKKPLTAGAAAPRLLVNVRVLAYIDKQLQIISEKSEIDAIRILKEEARLAFSDIGEMWEGETLIPPGDLPDDIRKAVAGVEIIKRTIPGSDGEPLEAETRYKYKLWDKGAALGRVERHLGMYDKDNAQRKIDDLTVKLTNFPPEPKSLEEWEATYKAAREARKGEKE